MARRCHLILGAAAAAALILAPAAGAHGTLAPPTAEAGSSQRFELTVPNDRQDAEIVAVGLRLPPGAELESAEAQQPLWSVSSDESVVAWQGGPINRGSGETFAFTVRLPPGAGRVEFALLETYDDGAAAPFSIPVSLTRGAGVEGGGDALALVAVVVAVLALVVATAALVLALRRREPPPRSPSEG